MSSRTRTSGRCSCSPTEWRSQASLDFLDSVNKWFKPDNSFVWPAEYAPDVDAADVANQRDRLVARLALVDHEVPGQRLPNPEPHQRVGVDDEAVWRLAQDRSILYPVKSAPCGRKGR